MNIMEELSDDLHPEELSESDEDPGDDEGPATAPTTARPFAVQIRTAGLGHRKLLQGFGKLQKHVTASLSKLSVRFNQATADLIPPTVTQKVAMFVRSPDIGTSDKNIKEHIPAERDVFVWFPITRDTVLDALAL